jgi:hypothetical protein
MVLVLCKRLNAEIKENKQVCLIKKTRNYIRRPKRLGISDKQNNHAMETCLQFSLMN